MSDPSFKRSRPEEYYALYYQTKMLSGRVNIRDYKPIFYRFSNILVIFFVKVHGWFTIIQYILNHILNHKVSEKCSSNYYHFSSRLTFIFVNRVFFAFFSIL